MRKLTWAQVCARRLAVHALTEPADDLVDVVGTVCGSHAQVMSSAELSIGLRVRGVNREDVRRALWTDRTLVKTYGMRGTVHLFPRDQLGIWLGALRSARRPAAGLPPDARLTDEQVDIVVDAIATALTGTALTVDELSAEVIRLAGPWAGDLVMPAFTGWWPRWRSALQEAAARGAVCFGPNRGRKVTYERPDVAVPDPADALAEVVRRYLHAYGPATADQFAQWFGMTKAHAREVFEALPLTEVDVEGSSAWELGSATVDEPPCGLRLLPYFDCYSVGAHPRPSVFPGVAAERALSRGQAGTVPVLLLDGVVAGIWHQRRTGSKLAVTVEPFGTLGKARLRELADQVARIGEVQQAVPTLTVGTVAAGKHL